MVPRNRLVDKDVYFYVAIQRVYSMSFNVDH